jgi:hypothetical protein
MYRGALARRYPGSLAVISCEKKGDKQTIAMTNNRGLGKQRMFRQAHASECSSLDYGGEREKVQGRGLAGVGGREELISYSSRDELCTEGTKEKECGGSRKRRRDASIA